MPNNNTRKRVATDRFTINHTTPKKKKKKKNNRRNTQSSRSFDLVDSDEDDDNQINLENNDSDKECEFDSEEEVDIRNIEKQSSDDNDFIAEEDDCEELLKGEINIHQMVLNATVGPGNTNNLERNVILRQLAHEHILDERSEHDDYERTITMDDINNGAEHIYNTMVTVVNNSNVTNNNIMSNSNNIVRNTTINHHHHYHNIPAPAETTIAVPSTQQAGPSTPPVEATSTVTTPIPRKALPQQQQQTSLIGPQDGMKLCMEYKMICQRMSNSISEDNWLIGYHQQKMKAKDERSKRWRERNQRYLVDNPEGRINRIKKELLLLIGE